MTFLNLILQKNKLVAKNKMKGDGKKSPKMVVGKYLDPHKSVNPNWQILSQ